MVNNVTRFLDSKKIVYTAFDLPAEKLGASESAELLGVPVDRVYKSIVVLRQGQGKPIIAVVPGSKEVDIRLLAKAVNEKKLLLATEKEAEKITGLQAGGISPLALLNKGFQVVIDESIQTYENIHISGGQRGLNIELAPKDLIKITNAKIANICSGN